METNIIIVSDQRSHRLRARKIDLQESAETLKDGAIRAIDGGSVNNSYGYAALSECAVLSRRGDDVFVWAAEIDANKLSAGGIVARCCGEQFRALFDERFGPDKKSLAKLAFHVLVREVIKTVEVSQ